MELIKTNLDLCTGCNRCVRECPMEPANIAYQDEDGNIKVKIDQDKCIACGRCLDACNHDARYHVDDTERFFEDLAKGVPISVMAAPAIRTNMPDWKRLFTYLKQLGVNLFFDVSVGADICIWSNIRHAQKSGKTPLITQPCPVIVTYCELYRQDLLKNLSPAHSPMACASVYMKDYKGITDRIAAISPCVAKANEFESTGLADYGITFTGLRNYLRQNKIELPEEETDFDSDESGLGSIFPMPGGLKENIEFFTGREISVDRGEGSAVYKMLEEYTETPEESLPKVFDVLNCQDGCNIGTACTHSFNIFKINREMDVRRKAATGGREREFFEELYRKYDDDFDLEKFSRQYKPSDVLHRDISEEDIEKAFLLLGKTDREMQTVNCGACGCDTCRSMARKIALGVNIPINCVFKTMEDAKTEHAIYIQTHEQLMDMTRQHETDELMRVLLDSNPFGANYWNKDLQLIDINDATVNLFKVGSKKEYIENFLSFSPEHQPDGRLSAEAAPTHLRKAFDTGHERCEWMHQTIDGEEVPCGIIMTRVEFKGEHIVAAYVRDLREQKRWRKEIEVAQSTTSAMFESNPHVNVLFNSAFKLIDCNPAGIKFLGFDNKEDMLSRFSELMRRSIPSHQPDGRPSVPLAQRLMTAAKEGHAKFETEMAVGGMRKTLNVEFKRIPYANSFAIVGYLYDMTEVRERERELILARELNDRQLATLNLVVKATKIGLWNMDVIQGDPLNPDNPFVWSDEMRKMLGFRNEKDFPNVTSSWSDRLHPEDKKRTLRAFKNHLLDTTGETPYDIEYRLKKKNGEYAYYHATGETVRDEKGAAIRAAGAIMDITETKNLLLDLEKEKSLLQTMFDSVPDLIFCKDMDFNYTRCNTSLLQYFDLKKKDLIGKDDVSGLGLPEKIAEGSRAIDSEVIKQRKIITYEEYVPNPAGEMRLFETNKVPLLLNGDIMGIMGVARDITERKAMEEAAQSANKAKSAFLSTMSHEIRTPMNAILGITEIQLQNEDLDKDLREGLEKIYASSDMLLSIINDILDLSKIEAGRLELLVSNYEMASLISDTAQLNMMRIGSKPIEFELTVDENTPVVLAGDELRVKQILNNILSNAFKYTDKGMVKMSVSSAPVEGRDDQEMLIIGISDTGQGMTKEEVDRLFDEYTRFNLETNRTSEGTGLGMSITRNLIRLMEGEIAIESEKGKGSVFTVFLPQGKVNSNVLGKEIAENLHRFRTSSRAQMRRVKIKREPMPYGNVMIVDDIESNIYVAKGLMAPYELKIDSADSGFSAIEKIKCGNVYDIVFMDHMMPVMDGVEATRKLREMGYDHPIVALTANAVSGQQEIFLGNGFDDFISKPIDVRQLDTILNRLIRDKQSAEVIEEARQQAIIHKEQVSSDTPKLDPQFAEVFLRDARKSTSVLETLMEKEEPLSDDELRTYTIHTHGIKSALANIGRMDLSAIALKLEQHGRDGSIDIIKAETPEFLMLLKQCIEDITPHDDTPAVSEEDEDTPFLIEKLLEIKEASELYDDSAIEEVIAELRQTAWSQQTNELLETISEKVLHSDFDEITEIISGFMET